MVPENKTYTKRFTLKTNNSVRKKRKYRILRNYGKRVPQLVQANLTDVHTVNGDAASGRLQNAKEAQRQS